VKQLLIISELLYLGLFRAKYIVLLAKKTFI